MHSPKAGGSKLLIGTDPSSTCLSCHQSGTLRGYYVATPDASMGVGIAPKQRTPGGDFGWLRKDYSWVPRTGAATEYSPGETHGHNIVAADTPFIADTTTQAPGGTFPSSQLGCTSCHDPHGLLRRTSAGTYVRGGVVGVTVDPIMASGSYDTSPDPVAGAAVGVYRLLRGMGDTSAPGVVFNNGVGIAVAPATYNRTEASTQTRVAYGATGTDTWGNWCASCHPAMHSTGNYVHKVDQALSTYATIYNAYVKSGDLSGGTGASAFTSLVPFAEANATIATLKSHAKNDNSYLSGPGSGDQVTCLSCHRAHASGWNHALRWNNESDFMVYNDLFPGTDTTPSNLSYAQGRTGAETQAAYYDRPTTAFAKYQRVLCNKCHAKD